MHKKKFQKSKCPVPIHGKAHVAGGQFCGVRRHPKFLGVFTQVCPSLPQFLVVFMQFWPSLPQKLDFCWWLDHRSTGLFPCMPVTYENSRNEREVSLSDVSELWPKNLSNLLINHKLLTLKLNEKTQWKKEKKIIALWKKIFTGPKIGSLGANRNLLFF